MTRRPPKDHPASGDQPELTYESGRRTPRQEVNIQVRVTVPAGAAKTYLTRDLSLDGVFIRTAQPLALGTLVYLDFALPRSPMMKVEGRVARALSVDEVGDASRAGMGIQFTRVKPAYAECIAHYVRAR